MSEGVEVRTKSTIPARWLALFALSVLGLGGLQLRSTDAQAESSETFQRALLEHAAAPHRDAANKLSMQRVEYIVETQGQDIEDLKVLFADMVSNHNELLIELRTRAPGGVR